MLSLTRIGGILAALVVLALPAAAQPPGKPQPLVRLFFQDFATQSLKWADVRIGSAGELSLGPAAGVDGFPALDAEKQKLVQMNRVQDKLLVGVRDEEDGQHGSGWVMLAAGARYSDHGDHGHWSFRKAPFAIGSRIDKEQGNPAHLYVYGGKFYLANDRKNGYTRFDPEDFPRVPDPQAGTRPRFLPGGGNHITLAVADDKAGYSSWIDGGGPNKGKVDVTNLATGQIAYSFRLPTGAIHGATVCRGKVFLAPADGICWVEADTALARKPEEVQVHHIPLGKDGDRPLRVGAFEVHDRWVLATTGKDGGGKLVLLDAAAANPKPTFVSLGGAKGTKPVPPAVAAVGGKRPLALVFHDRTPGSDAAETLDVVELDPNGDGDFADARPVKSLPVGPSAVTGHYGHHDIAFDANGEYGFLTNPGAGTIAVLDLAKLEFAAAFPVVGTPTAILALGGRDRED